MLSYSATEYACPVWARPPHASKLDPEMNDTCGSITGCLRPTNIEELYLLAGIAPHDIRRDVCARVEKKKQETNAAHSLHSQITAERRLKRECFLSSVRSANFLAKVIRCSEWQHRQNLAQHNCAVNLDESLAKGHTSPWAARRCLNRLRTGVACSKEQRKWWKYFNGDTPCECGHAPETTNHMLQCPLLAHPCTLDYLQKFNENDRKCVDKWKNAVWWHERRRRLTCYFLWVWKCRVENSHQTILTMYFLFDHMDEAYSMVGRTTALYVVVSVSFCLPHAVAFRM